MAQRDNSSVCFHFSDQITSDVYLMLLHFIILALLVSMIFFTYRIYAKRHSFPMAERCPLLAILQSFFFISYIYIPYFLEGFFYFFYSNDYWIATNSSEIPLTRIILKSLRTTSRFMTYLVFLIR